MTRYHRWMLAAVAAFAATASGGCGKLQDVPAENASATPPAANVSDIDVTEHVKTALLRTEALKGSEIQVVTTKGDVRLTGTVTSQAQADEALRVARAADGAHTMHNELVVKP